MVVCGELRAIPDKPLWDSVFGSHGFIFFEGCRSYRVQLGEPPPPTMRAAMRPT
jgi:hypothetical protein